MGRKSFEAKAEQEADYEYQQYLLKKKQVQDEMSLLQKFNVAYLPTIGEPLEIYVKRLQPILHQLDLQLQIHYNWFTHKRAGGCSICDTSNLGHYILEILSNISEQQKYTCEENSTNYGSQDFRFIKRSK